MKNWKVCRESFPIQLTRKFDYAQILPDRFYQKQYAEL